FERALANCAFLWIPTLPMKATPLPPPDAPRELYIQRAFEMVPNTAPFNASGHPAMSLPCGMGNGLPIGLMLIGKYYDEPTISRAARAFEGPGDWKKMYGIARPAVARRAGRITLREAAMDLGLEGKNVLITGGSKGIG